MSLKYRLRDLNTKTKIFLILGLYFYSLFPLWITSVNQKLIVMNHKSQSIILTGLIGIFLLSMVSGCKCDQLQADILEYEYILKFDYNAVNQGIDKIVIDSLIKEGDFIKDSCNCAPKLVLMGINPEADPVERTKGARTSVEESGGDGVGFYTNLEILLDDFEGDLSSFVTTLSFPGEPSFAHPSGGIIAVIDGGIKVELKKDEGVPVFNMWLNGAEAGETASDGIDNDGNCYTDDRYGYDFRLDMPFNVVDPPLHEHGTRVASIISKGHDELTSPEFSHLQPRLMDAKVFDTEGKSSLFDIICSVYYALEKNASVLNFSLGYYCKGDTQQKKEANKLLEEAIDDAFEKNVVIVAAAGNDNCDTDDCPFYPAAFARNKPNLISVAAFIADLEEISEEDDPIGQKAGFSNYGAESVTLAAPGENISSIDMNGAEKIVQGTSFSAPFVALIVSYIKSSNPEMSAKLVVDCLKEQLMTEIPDADLYTMTNGILNFENAVEIVNECCCP